MAYELGPGPTPREEENTQNTNIEQATQLEVVPDLIDTREVSRTASAINRVANFFEKRAINKAHAEAIKAEPEEMNRIYDSAMAENRDFDHAQAIVDDPAETAAMMGRAETAAIADNRDFDHVIANKDNKAFDKEARRQKRQEWMSSAKESILKVGRDALKVAKVTGLVAAGLGIMGAEAGARGVKKGAELTASAASNAKETAIAAGASTLEKAKNTGETIGIAALLAGDKVRGQAARARKAERALRHTTKEKAQATVERANTRRRKIGSGALSFFDRARASGQAATEVWKTHSEQNKIRQYAIIAILPLKTKRKLHMDPIITAQMLTDRGINLPANEQEEFLTHLNDTLSERVGTEITESLDDEKLQILLDLQESSDDEAVGAWIKENVPEMNQIIQDEIDILIDELATKDDVAEQIN